MRIPPLFALKTNYVKSFFLFLFVKIQTKNVNLKSSNEKDFNLNWSLRREKMVRKSHKAFLLPSHIATQYFNQANLGEMQPFLYSRVIALGSMARGKLSITFTNARNSVFTSLQLTSPRLVSSRLGS